jgi:predicted glycosyltransferase
MELVATNRPFAYVPLRRHWEQQHYVAHRLAHYGVESRLDFQTVTPASLAQTMGQLLASRPQYRPVKPGSARKAAERIASLLVREVSHR